jgi:hypothetical protein
MPSQPDARGNLIDFAGADGNEEHSDALAKTMEQEEQRSQLHPWIQLLSMHDLESCLKLEEATFPPNQRCSREKVRT